MSTTNPAGRPADEALIAAEQEIAALRRKGDDLVAAGDRGDHDEIWNRVLALETYVAQTNPDSPTGVAVKLRMLAGYIEGGGSVERGKPEAQSVRQVLAAVERSLAPTIGVVTDGASPEPSGANLPPNPDRAPFKAFTAHARLLRGLTEVRIAREAARKFGVDVSALPEPPSYEEIEKRYTEIMREWATEPVRSAGAAVAYIELGTSILFQEMRTDVDGEGVFPAANFDDLAFAAQMLGSTSRWLNERDIEDALREERATRTPRKGGDAA